MIALVPGIDPARSVLILAGTTTFGTQAAAEYVCRQDSLADLLRRLGVSKVADMKPFEALLHVKVTHGVPVITDLVAVRKAQLMVSTGFSQVDLMTATCDGGASWGSSSAAFRYSPLASSLSFRLSAKPSS